MTIDGKQIANEIRCEIKQRAEAYYRAYGIKPCLKVIIAGDDPASRIYVRNKCKACEKACIETETIELPETVTTEIIIRKIETLNEDPDVNAILVQLPLPAQVDTQRVLSAIMPEKDADGLHPLNCGMMFKSRSVLEPCTPSGCIELLKRTGVRIQGANAVVIGRSNLVGKPMALMLERENATVTLCHSKTVNLSEITKRADIVVCAIGRPGIITGDMLKPGSTVIDVGINRLSGGEIVGDVDFESAKNVCANITPVPGGVGPMTIAMLLKNTITAAEAQHG